MRKRVGILGAVGLAVALASPPAEAQTPPSPPPTETPVAVAPPGAAPAPAAPAASPVVLPAPAPVLRLVDPPVIAVESLPSENPFATTVEAPALAPPKLVAADAVIPTAFFAAIRVDPKGNTVAVRRARDPIPSLTAQSQASLLRWRFDPGRKSGQPVETWASLRLDLSAEIDSPKFEQVLLTPITPPTPIPKPLEWGTDAAWLASVKPPPIEGTIPTEQLDTPAIPISASDPALIAYFRKAMESWLFRPARASGAAASTWNELTLSGQISFSTDLKSTTSLRQSL